MLKIRRYEEIEIEIMVDVTDTEDYDKKCSSELSKVEVPEGNWEFSSGPYFGMIVNNTIKVNATLRREL